MEIGVMHWTRDRRRHSCRSNLRHNQVGLETAALVSAGRPSALPDPPATLAAELRRWVSPLLLR